MKYIELEQDTERTFFTICDAALKAGGMQMIGLINQLISAIKDDSARVQ